MANTNSAKKAIRSSQKKKGHNLMWEKKIKDIVKTLKADIESKTAKLEDLVKSLLDLQKAVDKAAKEKVIHKNKANRLKSIYAKKISARTAGKPAKPAKAGKKSTARA